MYETKVRFVVLCFVIIFLCIHLYTRIAASRSKRYKFRCSEMLMHSAGRVDPILQHFDVILSKPWDWTRVCVYLKLSAELLEDMQALCLFDLLQGLISVGAWVHHLLIFEYFWYISLISTFKDYQLCYAENIQGAPDAHRQPLLSWFDKVSSRVPLTASHSLTLQAASKTLRAT